MEASVAAGGQVEAGEGTQQEQGGDAFAPVLDRMQESIGELGSRLEQRLDARLSEFAPPGEAEPTEQELFEQQFQELFGGEQEQAGLDPAALQQAMTQVAQQAAQPALDEAQRLRAELENERLYEKYPDLKDPEVDQKVGALVAQYAQRLGLQQPSAALAELAYKAYKADKVASSEVPAGDSHVTLEGGGGAAPDLSDEDVATRIVQAGGARRPLY